MKQDSLTKVKIYTDGACSGNPGMGGWACILLAGNKKKELSGAVASTTNNRMEMLAIIRGLEALKRPCDVEVFSDSAYVINAFKLGWLDKWKKNSWQNVAKKPVANIDLWKELLSLQEIHSIQWNKVKGHSNDELNNRCDELAVNAIKIFRRQHKTGEGY